MKIMTKRTIKETQIITKEMYEAEDGRLFESEEACKEYDKKLETIVAAEWEKIPKGIVSASDFFMTASCDEDITLIIPRNMEDIKIINMYTYRSESELFTSEDIGKTLVFSDYEGDYYEIKGGIDKLRNEFEKAVEQINVNLTNYGVYKATVKTCDYVGETKKFYSEQEVINSAKNLVSAFLRRLDTDSTRSVTITITKDGDKHKEIESVATYNKSTYEFKMEI